MTQVMTGKGASAKKPLESHCRSTSLMTSKLMSRIGASKTANVQLDIDTRREEFVARRHARDAKLEPPRLLYPSVQVNIDAGRLPKAHANGRRYLVMPLSASPIELGSTQ